MALQLGQVVEGVGAAQLTSVNQAHEQVAHLRPVQRPIEQGILPVKNRPLQRPFDEVMPTPGLCRVDETSSLPAFLSMLIDAA